MTVTFWGVRGSTPAPGTDTVRYGGNTACVSVQLADRLLVLDAGTGIQALGHALCDDGPGPVAHAGDTLPITILLTHLHTDHISGFPFFRPLFEPEQSIELIGYPHDGGYWSLLDLLDGVHFPVEAADVPSTCTVTERPPNDVLPAYGATIDVVPVTHPGGAHGYRLHADGHDFVFIPDHEIGAATMTTPLGEVADFCRGADVLCHDAQYVDGEFPERRGWGHSRVDDVCALAVRAEVSHLVLFHHDPRRTDAELDRIERRARQQLAPHGIRCTAAYEGLSFDLS